MKRITAYCVCLLASGWLAALGMPQSSTVTGRVNLLAANGAARTGNNAAIVVWLTPLSNSATGPPLTRRDSVRPSIVQRNKRFETRVLAIEVGTTVDFPNKDPFFHNVFSHYDGKRFDLKLYEAGATRSMLFDRPGVCYLFCNIHSQMSAAIVVVDTPYFLLLNAPGEFRIPGLPPGRYHLNVWAERCSPDVLKAASRQVTIENASTSVGTVQLQESRERVAVHPNKYGRTYETPVFSSPIYAP